MMRKNKTLPTIVLLGDNIDERSAEEDDVSLKFFSKMMQVEKVMVVVVVCPDTDKKEGAREINNRLEFTFEESLFEMDDFYLYWRGGFTITHNNEEFTVKKVHAAGGNNL